MPSSAETYLDRNDIALVHMNGKPFVFARIEGVEPDLEKSGLFTASSWWRVKMMALFMPPKVYIWVLKDEHMRGAPFTINGVEMSLSKIVTKEDIESHDEPEPEKEVRAGEVIDMFSRKRIEKETEDGRA